MDDLPGLSFTRPIEIAPQLDGRVEVGRDVAVSTLGAIGNGAAQSLPRNPTLSDVHEFVLDYVEQPLQKACELLLANGVRTRDSSANHKNAFLGFSQITIDYASLPPLAKQRVHEIRDYFDALGVPDRHVHKREMTGPELYIGQLDGRTKDELVALFIPTDYDTTLGFIEDESMKFAIAVTKS